MEHLELLFYIGCEGTVVVFAAGETAIDDTDQFCLCPKTEFIVRDTGDVVVEDVFDAFFRQSQSRHKFVVRSQGHLKLHGHPGQYGIDALLVHLSKTQSALLQEQVTGMLTIVQVVGIVDDALDVALIIAHLHPGFKNILLFHNQVQR